MNNQLLSLSALICTLALVLSGCGSANEEDAAATSMRLRKMEGEVQVSDDAGKSLKAREDLALYSGYDMRTKAESYSWIDLDSVKLAKLDESSRIGIEKDGGDLTIQLKKGNIFFHITEPLGDDESMEIRTSTLAIGIRGTCGWIETSKDGAAQIFLLEGKVTCTAGDQKTTVSAGEMAYIDEGGEIVVEQFDASAIPSFVEAEAEEDDELAQMVRELPGQGGTNASGLTSTPSAAPTSTPAPPAAPVTYTVTFNLNNGPASAIAPTHDPVPDGEKITDPAYSAIYDGKTVAGWYQDAACTQKWDFAADTVTENTTLYAKWIGKLETANLWWSLDNGVLTIGGKGNMPDYPPDSADLPWYNQKEDVRTLAIEPGITSVGSYAFYGCSNLVSVTIPSTVKTIGGWAFSHCTGLPAVILPEGVTSIGQDSFAYCYQLKSIDLPDSLRVIGDYAIGQCHELTAITIPAGLESLGYGALNTCPKLATVYFPGTQERWNELASGKELFFNMASQPVIVCGS